MIKLPHGDATSNAENGVEDGVRTGLCLGSVLSAGDRALVETGLYLCRMPLPHRSGLRSGLPGLQPIVARLRWDQTASPGTHRARCTQSRPIPQSGAAPDAEVVAETSLT